MTATELKVRIQDALAEPHISEELRKELFQCLEAAVLMENILREFGRVVAELNPKKPLEALRMHYQVLTTKSLYKHINLILPRLNRCQPESLPFLENLYELHLRMSNVFTSDPPYIKEIEDGILDMQRTHPKYNMEITENRDQAQAPKPKGFLAKLLKR